MSVARVRVACPACDRITWVVADRHETHHAADDADYCFMSGMPTPVHGRGEDAMRRRAQVAAGLALEVRDGDPHTVWRYLEVMPELFVRELLQVTLAGLNVENRRVSDIWEGWVR